MEARVGIEPTHRAFAELGLTTWLPRLNKEWVREPSSFLEASCFSCKKVVGTSLNFHLIRHTNSIYGRYTIHYRQ